MEELIISPPKSIMEVYRMLPEGTLAELINKVIYISPSPISQHQRIISKLLSKVYPHVESNGLGEVFIAPFDVYLDEHSNAVQPDIVFVSKENSHIIKDHIHGVPDLVIEVLSEGNKNHDLKRKRKLYEKFGVKEYWMIDPETKEAIGLTLQQKKYAEFFRGNSVLKSALLKKQFEF
ncbi:MAG: Uma2 family endonuclease [Bacteroidota bacterium]